MRAAICGGYGGPEVVEIRELADPVPGDNDLLVRVTTSTVNRTSAEIRSCTPPWAVRPMYGFRRPRKPVLGTDFAGVIEAMGAGVRDLSIGDRVFGFDDQRMGAHAELHVMPASAGVMRIPDGVSDDDAAASVEGAHYALTYIERADLAAGKRALVYGGGGAIGSAAVQILVSGGIEVVAVVEAHQLELMHSLGAVRAIDYRATDFTAIDERVDFVLDAVGHTTFAACRRLLADDGCFMATELGPRLQNVRLALSSRFRRGPRVHFPLPVRIREHVKTIAGELAAGTFRPVIDRAYPLEEIVDAYRYVDTASKTGNVLLRIDSMSD